MSYPVCCPSRATFFSGQYAHNHDVLGLYPPTGGYGKFDMDNSLGTWLQRSGYHTGHIGKMLNGYGSDTPADLPRGFNEWYASVDPSTYRMHGYTLNENGTFVTYGEPDVEDPATYQTDVFSNKAVDYIRRNAAQARSSSRSRSWPPTTSSSRSASRRGSRCARRPATRACSATPSCRSRPTSARPTSPTSRTTCSAARRR